jgi:hypothetical protein
MQAVEEFTAEECAATQRFYQRTPIDYQIDMLDVKPEHVWSKMVEMAESVRDHQKTCVEAGHSVSKDYEAARIALWFLACFGPRCTVVISGPGQNQVENVFFREVRDAYNNAKKPYGGNLITCKLDLDPKWFMIGFTAAEDPGTDENTRMQGFHNEYVLVILTEAAGVPVSVRKAVDGLIITDKHRLLTYGNPTKAQGSFAEDSEDPSFNHITISVLDTPNYKEGREVIPGVSGREYEESVRLKYGVDSNEYAINVLGRKPEYTAGTYLGKGLAKAEQDGRIGSIIHDITQPVYTFSDLGDVYSAWWFVQFIKGFVHLIDFYYDSEGRGLPVYAKMLQDKPYKYGDHFTLPDIFETGSNKKSLHTGQYTVDVARSLKIDFKRVDLPIRDHCIRAAQDLMGVCKFSATAQEGVEGLYDWRKRKNEALSTPDKPVYYDEPVKSWGRHVGDAFCGVAVAYRYTSIGGEVLGSLERNLPEEKVGNNVSFYDNRVLSRGMKLRV